MITYPYGDLDALAPTVHEIAVLGERTRYWAYGPAEAAHTVIMVHGFRGDHHGMEAIIARLPGCRVIAPDLPGFGGSSPFPANDHGVESYARWLIAVVQLIAPGRRITVVGHSFGSVVVAAAIAGGLAPARAILINPIAGSALDGPRRVLSRLAAAYYRLGARLPEGLGTRLLGNSGVVRGLSTVMAKSRDRRLRRWIHDQHHRYFSRYADRHVVLEAFTASVSHDVSEYADALELPTLLIGADRDDISPVATQRRLAARLADGQLLVINGVGHLIHYEAPEEAAAAITAFLAAP